MLLRLLLVRLTARCFGTPGLAVRLSFAGAVSLLAVSAIAAVLWPHLGALAWIGAGLGALLASWLLIRGRYALLPRLRGPRTGLDRLHLDYAARFPGEGIEHLAAAAIHTGIGARELLTAVATGGRLDWQSLVVTLEHRRVPPLEAASRRALAVLRPREAALLARVVLVQQALPDDTRTAAALYTAITDRYGLRRLAPLDQQYAAEALLATGSPDLARAITSTWTRTDPDLARLHADTLNPHRDGATTNDESGWITALTQEYTAAALAPPTLHPEGPSPFDRLDAPHTAPVEDHRTVTVVIASHGATPALETSLRSVLASTWQHLEILLYNDAADTEHDDAYQRLAGLDPRIRYHRMTSNGGTYAIRNHALDHATGAFITFHDDDDWMHPQRIALQIAHLDAHPELPANTSPGIRATTRLELAGARGHAAKICEPSLTIRHPHVRDRIGYFDTVRKSGDLEYRHRINAAWNTTTPTITTPPLTIQRHHTGSLSSLDITRGWASAPRRQYQQAFQRWHAEIARGRRSARLLPGAPRPFPAPAGVTAAAQQQQRLVVLHAADLAVLGLQPRQWRRFRSSLGLGSGVPATVLHTPSAAALHGLTTQYPNGLLTDWAQGRLVLIDPRSIVQVERLLVWDSACMPLLEPELRRRLSAEPEHAAHGRPMPRWLRRLGR